MAHGPRSGDARRGVVQPPNEAGPGGNRANNGFLLLAGSAGPLPPAGPGGGDRRNGSFPIGKMASPVHAPVQRFDVETAKMPQPPSASEPGRGAIPVNPWNAEGQPSRTISESEIPREPRR
jgi:hypothetical protein